MITEPAFAVLSRELDEAAMGHRRYRIADIAILIERAGLRIAQTSYFTSFGFPLLLAMKLNSLAEAWASRCPKWR